MKYSEFPTKHGSKNLDIHRKKSKQNLIHKSNHTAKKPASMTKLESANHVLTHLENQELA